MIETEEQTVEESKLEGSSSLSERDAAAHQALRIMELERKLEEV